MTHIQADFSELALQAIQERRKVKSKDFSADQGVIDMLILTRRVGESLIIGNDVEVQVLGVKGNQVRIGVDAPKEVTVHRDEIYQRIKAENVKF